MMSFGDIIVLYKKSLNYLDLEIVKFVLNIWPS